MASVMSDPFNRVEHMDTDTTRSAAIAMAALELLPAEPRDLTQILRNDEQRRSLMSLIASADAEPLTTYLCENLDSGRIDHWHKDLDALHQRGLPLPTLASESAYPSRLKSAWDAPPMLFVQGHLTPGPSIAIVGSRAVDDRTYERARALAGNLASNGTAIVSGLAAGTDTAAHLGALDAQGRTVAVMGTGMLRTYPVDNSDLRDQIVDRGAVVSQFAPGAPRTGTTFLRRNCVIAGLADVSLVMDGRDRSGSRHEVEQAIDYGRPALLWGPTLKDEPWARLLVDRKYAAFVSSTSEVADVVKMVQ